MSKNAQLFTPKPVELLNQQPVLLAHPKINVYLVLMLMVSPTILKHYPLSKKMLRILLIILLWLFKYVLNALITVLIVLEEVRLAINVLLTSSLRIMLVLNVMNLLNTFKLMEMLLLNNSTLVVLLTINYLLFSSSLIV